MMQLSVSASRIWDSAFVALAVGVAGFTPACETNACLPSTTCVSGPAYGETFSAAVSISDAAAGDAGPDASLEADSPDGEEPLDSAAEGGPSQDAAQE